ncbi:MAG: hypothetical protein OXN83_02300 [Oligoflexia bacterium]|nr:hypothetical protein [Oligoflexia bacterium]
MKKVIYVNSIFLLFFLILLFFLVSSPVNDTHLFYRIYAVVLLVLVVSSSNIYFIFRCLYQSYLSFTSVNLSSTKTQNLNSESYTENKSRNFEIDYISLNEDSLNKKHKPITFVPALCFSLLFIYFCQFFISSYKLFDNFFIFGLLIAYLFYFLFYFLLKKLFANLDKKNTDLLLIKLVQPLSDNFKKILILLKCYQNKVFTKYKVIKIDSKKIKKNIEGVLLFILGWFVFSIITDFLQTLIFARLSLLFTSTVLAVTCFIYGLIYAFLDLDNKWHYSKISYHWFRVAFKNYYSPLMLYFLVIFSVFYFSMKYFDFDLMGLNLLETMIDFNINWYDPLFLIF